MIKYRILAVIAGLVMLVGGCDVAAHRISTPQVPKSPPMVLPSPPAPVYPGIARPAFQAGIDIDWYAYKGENYAAQADQTASWVRSLHANAVSISFPFFTDVPSSSVYASSATPTPAQLAVVVRAFEEDDLWVVLRPLLDEQNLHTEVSAGMTRPWWTPPNVGAWMASYESFLMPYAQMAQTTHAGELIVGTELVQFEDAPQWASLDQQVRLAYSGLLGCANNFTGPSQGGCGPGAVQSMDAYQPISPPLQSGWDSYVRSFGPGYVLSEVGIAAASYAYQKPWIWNWGITQLYPQMQSDWFTAACQAELTQGGGGIYFWSANLDGHPGPTLADQGAWSSQAISAISSCYSEVK